MELSVNMSQDLLLELERALGNINEPGENVVSLEYRHSP